MPSTLILGSPAGPDGAGGAFQNTVEADRAALWDALGGAQGVIRGFGFTGVAGQMALEIDANSSALVGERAQDGTASLKRGYHVYTPGSSATLISFDPASASGRNDAVVAAFVDTEDGALGTGVSQAGPQVVVVTGVSGTTVPRTDTEINTWIGRGGWVRLYDVPIASTDTEINTANMTVHDVFAGTPSLKMRALSGSLASGGLVSVPMTVTDWAEGITADPANGACTIIRPGKYRVTAYYSLDYNVAGVRAIELKAGAQQKRKYRPANDQANAYHYEEVSGVYYLAADDVIEVNALQNSGVSLNYNQTNSDGTGLVVEYVGP